MFTKNRPSDSNPQPNRPAAPDAAKMSPAPAASGPSAAPQNSAPAAAASAPRPKAPASVLSSDLTITGNVHSTGDIQIEGTIEGDIRAQTLTVGETAIVRGEVMADEVITHGRVIGRLRGIKVRLSSSARVEGDVVHKNIAIESGAHFEGSVQRSDDPLGQSTNGKAKPAAAPAASASAPQREKVSS